MEPTNLWWKPDAPEPNSGETIAQLEKNQAYKTKAGTDIKIGQKSVTSCLVVLGQALGSHKTKVYNPNLHKFPHVCLIWDFHALSHKTPQREVDAGEAGHTPKCNIDLALACLGDNILKTQVCM